MEVKSNTTVYLCADTGMDANNSIWWDKYAYQSGPYQYQGYWHHVKMLWFKAHACSEGFWYQSEIKAGRGWVKLGRTPLQTEMETGDKGLHSEVDDLITNSIVPFADILMGRCDYMMWVNGYNDDESQPYYAFIDKIESININVCRIYFTIDAIETYGRRFNFGPSVIQRDMQHLERAYNLVPNPEGMNYHSEPFMPNENDYIFQRFDTTQDIIEKSYLGKYSKLFVMSDVALNESDITPNTYYGGLPSFKMTEATTEGDVTLGIGVYYLPNRKCKTLDLLGSYNAVEHLLYTYMVPEKLTPIAGGPEPVFIKNTASVMNSDYVKSSDLTLLTPIAFNDNSGVGPKADGYKPLNLKCYYSPACYVSISDGQGSSVEVELQSLSDYQVGEDNYFNLDVLLELSIAPNVGSCLYIKNNLDFKGGLYDPLVTLWQMPSYAMTPNNSGYNQDYVNAVSTRNAGLKQIAIGGAVGLAMMALSASAAPVALGVAGIEVASAAAGSTFLGSLGQGAVQGALAGGIGQIGKSFATERAAQIKETFGLPKAMGGMAQGFTRFNMNYAGYQYYFVHQRTEIIKQLDIMFSIFGYNQGEFRYPHINTRRRWTYVQAPNISIIGKGHTSDLPSWAKDQIKSRLAAGITFWNVRWGLLGDDDENADPSSITSFNDSRIQAIKGHKFVRNYGNLETRTYLEENMSTIGGYCANYTDNFGNGLLDPD